MLQQSGFFARLVLVIYGVDECEGDKTQCIIHYTHFAKFLSTNDSLVIVLFSSRTENTPQNSISLPTSHQILTTVAIR